MTDPRIAEQTRTHNLEASKGSLHLCGLRYCAHAWTPDLHPMLDSKSTV